MNTTTSYSFDPDIGLPIDSLRGGITLVDDAVHVKCWKNTTTGEVTVCVVPMNGEVSAKTLQIHNPGGGSYPGHYTNIKPTNVPPQRCKNGKPFHGHEWQHPAVADRNPRNWCGLCKDWFIPDRFNESPQ